MSVSRSQTRVCQVSTLSKVAVAFRVVWLPALVHFTGLFHFLSSQHWLYVIPHTMNTIWSRSEQGKAGCPYGLDMLFSKPAHKVSCTGLWHWLHQQMRWLVLMCSVCKWSGHQWHASAALPPVGRSRTAWHTHSVTKKTSLLVETHKNPAMFWMYVT